MNDLNRRTFLRALSLTPAAALLAQSGLAQAGLEALQPNRPGGPIRPKIDSDTAAKRARAEALAQQRELAGETYDAPTLMEWHQVRDVAWVDIDLEYKRGGKSAIIKCGPEDALVIGAKFPYIGELILRDAVTLTGVPEDRITFINTHHHADHAGGNWAFRNVKQRLAHKNALPRIASSVDRMVLASTGGEDLAKRLDELGERVDVAVMAARQLNEMGDGATEAFVPDAVDLGRAGERAELKIGNTTAILRHFGPGHSDCDLVIEMPDLDLVVAGDLLFAKCTPHFDPEGGVSAEGWLGSLERLRGLCGRETVVIPGYGHQRIESWDTSIQQNTVRTGAEIVDLAIEYHSKLHEHVRSRIASGGDRRTFVRSIPAFMHGHAFGGIRSTALGVAWDQLGGPAPKSLKDLAKEREGQGG